MNHGEYDLKTTEGFEKLFRDLYSPIAKKIFFIIKDTQAAEDLAQDIFIKLWEKRNTLEVSVSLPAYLHRAASNRAFNHLRNTHSFLEIESLSELETSPVEEIDFENRYKKLLDLLPPACRAIFIMSREDEMSYKEIAENLNISIKTVENQMTKALKIMREKITHYLASFIALINFINFF